MRIRTFLAVSAAVAALLASGLAVGGPVGAGSAQAAAARVSTKTLLAQVPVRAAHSAGYRRALFPTWTTKTVKKKASPKAATSGAAITSIYFDSPGPDKGSRASLNAEAVTIKNTTKSTRVLTGWRLRDASRHVFTFGTFSLHAGKTVTVHTGTGKNTAANLYWGRSGRGGYIWNNTGDTATLANAAGKAVDTCRYTARQKPKARC